MASNNSNMTPVEKTLEPPEGFTVLQEGKARILQRANDVFYNKAQVVNRDLSISVMRQFQKVRAAEYAASKAPKNKRAKGLLCATPRDSPLLPYLLAPEARPDTTPPLSSPTRDTRFVSTQSRKKCSG